MQLWTPPLLDKYDIILEPTNGVFFYAKGSTEQTIHAGIQKTVVEIMQKEKLSCRETARQFEINDHGRVSAWERIYMTEGPERFAIERRCRWSDRSRKNEPSSHPIYTPLHFRSHTRKLFIGNAGDLRFHFFTLHLGSFLPYAFLRGRSHRPCGITPRRANLSIKIARPGFMRPGWA